MDCSPPSSSVHEILQARILEWVALSFSRGSSRPRDRIQVSHIAGRRFNLCTTREAPSILEDTGNHNFLTLFPGYASHVLDCQNNSAYNVFWPRSVLFPLYPAPSPQKTSNKLTIRGLGFSIDVKLSSVQSLSRVRLFVTPWTAALQVSLSVTNSRSLLRLTSIESVVPSNHLILCPPLLLPPSVFPSIRVFSNASALPIRWPRCWRFSRSQLNCVYITLCYHGV